MIRFLPGVVMCSAILSFFVAFLNETDITAAALQRGETPSRVKRVDELYKRNCARCHGPDGRSDTPLGQVFNSPDFTDPEWWRENSSITSTKSLRLIVAGGRAGMPAFGKKLSCAEINLLVERVRKFRK
ncbi:MAG: c-type cytochrome [Pyrinomonadaceae bacterium]